MLSIRKAALFLIVTTLALYLPQADQYKIQWETNHYVNVFLCCLSDIYAFMLTLATILLNIIQSALNALRDGFHEIKLLFYSFLKEADRKDLCRTVCCFEEREEYVAVDNLEPEGKGEGDKPPQSQLLCRCVKKKCKRKY